MKDQLKHKVFLILFIITGILPPIKAYATIPAIDLCSMAISATVSSLYSYLLDSAGELVDVKVETSEEYVANQEIIIAEIESQKKAQTAALAATLKQHAIAQNTQKNNLIYSPLGQSNFACCEKNRAVGVVNGSHSLPIARIDIYNAMDAYNNGQNSPNEAYKTTYAASQEPLFQSGRAILPTHATLSENELALASYTAAILTNPIINYEPPAKYLNKPAGKKYQTLRRMKQAKISVSQMALANLISRKAPLYPLEDWMHQMCLSIGIAEDHPDIKNGMISAEALLNMEVESRYANPGYILDLHRKTKTGVLRELLAVEAINMEFHRLELINQQYSTALQASLSSTVAQDSINKNLRREFKGSILESY